MLDPDETWAQISAASNGGDPVMVLLGEYWIGDDYDIPTSGGGLTVSLEHLIDMVRDGDEVRATAFFPVDLVPLAYHDRVNPNGVVPIGVRLHLSAVYAISALDR
jgi:hypothetical protein